MATGICCIFNLAPHYRESIYKMMDRQLECDFFIGDKLMYPIKKMNYSELKGFKRVLKFQRLVNNFYWQRGAVSLSLRPYRCYIMNGEPFCVSAWIILILNRLQGKKTFLWTHGWYGDETWIKRNTKYLFFKLSSHILLYGDYAKTLMAKEGFSRAKLTSIYNSLDYEKQKSIRQRLKDTQIYTDQFQNNYSTLIYIGRIQVVKRLDLLFSALDELDKKGCKYNLTIIGEVVGGYSIEKEIEKYQISKRTWLYGPCYDEEKIGELIYNADICVSPGNIGLTAIHSLMYGTSVITHNNFINQMPEFEAITEGVTGTFFNENDVTDLSMKIANWQKYVATNKEKIRKNAFATIDSKFNPYYQLNVIKSLLNEQEGGRR